MSKILIADDSKELRDALSKLLIKQGHQVETAADGITAVEKVEQNFYDLLLTDVRMPKLDGLEVLKKTKSVSPETIVVVITAFGTVNNAVEAMRRGAFDYALKPFSQKEIEIKVKKALDSRVVGAEDVKEGFAAKFDRIIGNCEDMQEVYRLIKKVAPTAAPVLVMGETGTGKELVARKIHQESERSKGPFVAVNCMALASGVLESELFGHEKGAFTGAMDRHKGKFEIADRGTLFLDEVGELTPGAQVTLLRFLQDKEFQRVGGTKDIRVDVRVIAATNKDLKKSIEKGAFREDLFYRLNMVSIALPPLRDRGEDLYELVDHFVRMYNAELHKSLNASPELIGVLKNYDWPGNVRELENVIAQAAIIAEGDSLDPEHLPLAMRGYIGAFSEEKKTTKKTGVKSQVDAVEREIIRKTLEETDWNKSKAAERMGIHRTTLQYKMKKLGISPKNNKPD